VKPTITSGKRAATVASWLAPVLALLMGLLSSTLLPAAGLASNDRGRDQKDTRCTEAFCVEGLQDAPSARLPSPSPSPSPLPSRRSGTAWLSDTGYLVTSLHVVDGQDGILVISTLGARYSARLVASDTANDIAILAFPGNRRISEGMRTAVEPARLGAAVSFIGYPMPALLGRQPKVQAGIIFGRDGPRDDPRYMQISAPALAGHSGSPVLDAEGAVVGMVVGRLTLSNGQDIPQLALAVKVAHVAALLGRLPEADPAPGRASIVDAQAARRIRPQGVVTESVYLVLSEAPRKEPLP
jgi:S1-C subfamily serine protease